MKYQSGFSTTHGVIVGLLLLVLLGLCFLGYVLNDRLMKLSGPASVDGQTQDASDYRVVYTDEANGFRAVANQACASVFDIGPVTSGGKVVGVSVGYTKDDGVQDRDWSTFTFMTKAELTDYLQRRSKGYYELILPGERYLVGEPRNPNVNPKEYEKTENGKYCSMPMFELIP